MASDRWCTPAGTTPRVVFAYTFLARFGSFVVPFLAAFYTDGRGLTGEAAGGVIAVGSLGLVLGNVAGGWLSDRWGGRTVLRFAPVVNAAGFSGVAWANPALDGISLFVGMAGIGLSAPAVNALIATQTYGFGRSRAYALNYVAANVGMGLGPLLGGYLARMGYHSLFAAQLIANATLFGIAVAIRPPASQERAGQDAATDYTPAPAWLVPMICVVNLLLIAPLIGLEFLVPVMVRVELGSPFEVIGAVYAVNGVTVLSTTLPIRRVIQRVDAILMLVVATGFWAAGLGVLLVTRSVPSLLVSTAVWTVGEVITAVLTPDLVACHTRPNRRGCILGVLESTRGIAAVVCPLVVGAAWGASGSGPVICGLLALPAAAGLVCLASRTALLFKREPINIGCRILLNPPFE